MAKPKYEMTMDLNVLHHLGIKLYSNVSAVLSEAVANAWDADATQVDIEIESDRITITDNGHGMTVTDANQKYLRVGYERRKQDQGATTLKFKRPVMGRKGIGKLSLFSIADTIEVQSIRDKEKHALQMSASKIEETMSSKAKTYHPDAIPPRKITLDHEGTKIILTDLKKRAKTAASALRKRLARRFSVLGAEHDFVVAINGDAVEVTDRDYFHKIQYLWYYGSQSREYRDYCQAQKLDKSFRRSGTVSVKEKLKKKTVVSKYAVSGWIGTVAKSGDLKDEHDNLNKIVIMVRGKLAQEDILEDFSAGGLYTKYLMGEIHADFLDEDNKEDIATSNRQEIRKDDPRYVGLREWVETELKNIEASWTALRREGGTAKALEEPAIKEWFESLPVKSRKKAEVLFGRINELTVPDKEKKVLFKHGVLAFESLRYKDNLEALDALTPENIAALKDIFSDLDDLEATLYHQIVVERLRVIETLQKHVADNALEKVVQQHLYDHLWLLDPSWDRATETPLLEQQVATEFGKLDAKLTREEKRARYDIKYKNPSGKHVVIELKRAGRSVNSLDLAKQVLKYKAALTKILKAAGKEYEPVEVVCLVGKQCADWTDPKEQSQSLDMLQKRDIRVLLYGELIQSAYVSYKSFIDKRGELGRIAKVIESVDD